MKQIDVGNLGDGVCLVCCLCAHQCAGDSADALREALILQNVIVFIVTFSLMLLKLKHPNIVSFDEAFRHETFVCIVMEFCEVCVCACVRVFVCVCVCVCLFGTTFMTPFSSISLFSLSQGGDLDGRIKQCRSEGALVSQPQVLDWLVQLTMALKYMHDLWVGFLFCGEMMTT
jgi:serine/threonine protein kinase